MKTTVHPRVAKTPRKASQVPSRARPTRSARDARAGVAASAPPHGEDRRDRIALAAYYRAEKRGFAPGSELEDWLAAEAEIDGRSLLEHQLAHSDT